MKSNPFIISGYNGPEFFCDRKNETGWLKEAIVNSRNVTLMAPRRMGKSGLIHHTFATLSSKSYIPVYIDILATTNLQEFASVFIKSLLTAVYHHQGTFQKVLKQLSHLRISLSVDSLNGSPSLSFTPVNIQEAEDSIESAVSYIKTLKSTIVVAIDEFQQIAGYPESSTEAFLRTHFQGIQNMVLIFSGSRRHLLTEMFTSPGRPFFGSTSIMDIDKIDAESYSEFISNCFTANNKKISAKAIDKILYETNSHTYYVQYLCNRLFEHKTVTDQKVYEMLNRISLENESVYASYLNLLTRNQFRLLRAVSLNRGIDTPTSKDFIGMYRLGAASTVSQSLGSLIDKEFIYLDKGNYMPNDPFFSAWLRSSVE